MDEWIWMHVLSSLVGYFMHYPANTGSEVLPVSKGGPVYLVAARPLL